jgi:hypothetical protein
MRYHSRSPGGRPDHRRAKSAAALPAERRPARPAVRAVRCPAGHLKTNLMAHLEFPRGWRYTRTMHPLTRAVMMTLTAMLLAPGMLRAGGNREPDQPADRDPGALATRAEVQAYWILDEGAANAEMLLDRFYLPTSLSVLRWTEYRVTSEGVELSSEGGYRVVRKELLRTEAWKRAVLYGYTVRVSFTDPGDRPSRSARTLTISFSYDTAAELGMGEGRGAAAVPQPLQQALLKGIEAGGKKSGMARVLELEYQGKGRFQARVELQ